MADLISTMKERIKSSGISRREVFYIGADSKRRIRFLQELNEGYEYTFHSHWTKGINALCAEQCGLDCLYCEDTDPEMKTYSMYAWSVWDSDANAVQILLYKVTGITPVPQLIEFYEEYGTIMDRDYTIKKTGKGMGSSITVIPGEISKFRNTKAKPYTEKQVKKILAKAFPANVTDSVSDEDVEEEEVANKAKSVDAKKAKSEKKQKKPRTLENKLHDLHDSELADIAFDFGISKKETKGLDKDEVIDLLISDYDEEDLLEAYSNYRDDDE